jgi:transcriptional regulator with XRE-family HTH domain
MSTAEVILLSKARELAASGEAARIRKRSRLHQTDVARAAGVLPSTVSRWEAGERVPHGKAAVRWARVLERLEGGDASESRELAVTRGRN